MRSFYPTPGTTLKTGSHYTQLKDNNPKEFTIINTIENLNITWHKEDSLGVIMKQTYFISFLFIQR